MEHKRIDPNRRVSSDSIPSRYEFDTRFWQTVRPTQMTVEDTFVGSGKLATSEGPMEIFVNKAGQLFRKRMKQFFHVGQLQGNGQFIMNTGFQGNVFYNPHFRIPVAAVRGPLGDELRMHERQVNEYASEARMIRQHLSQYGVTGAGVRIGFLEKGDMDKDGNLEAHHHTKAVAAVVSDPRWGISPGATAQMLPFPKGKRRPDPKDTEAFLFEFLNMAFSELPLEMARYFDKIGSTAPPDLRVLNVSYGTSLVKISMMLGALITDRKPDGSFRYPRLRQIVLGPYANATEPKVVNGQMLRFLNEAMHSSPAFDATMKEYRAATERLANRGIIAVVSTGNQHNHYEGVGQVPPLAELNFLAMSDHVIRVAWGSNNGTPHTTADDYVTMASSRGDGRRWNPTITGREWWIDRYYRSSPNGLFMGTSAAAPVVSATIALMLQRNPALTFEQVVHRLQSTATNTGAPVQDEGAGMLNIVRAVLG